MRSFYTCSLLSIICFKNIFWGRTTKKSWQYKYEQKCLTCLLLSFPLHILPASNMPQIRHLLLLILTPYLANGKPQQNLQTLQCSDEEFFGWAERQGNCEAAAEDELIGSLLEAVQGSGGELTTLTCTLITEKVKHKMHLEFVC